MKENMSETKNKFKIGERALRRRSSDREPIWVEFIVNKTYRQLMVEFPEDYRHVDRNSTILRLQRYLAMWLNIIRQSKLKEIVTRILGCKAIYSVYVGIKSCHRFLNNLV